MLSFEYCKPINAKAVPAGPDWIHEVSYRGRVVRAGRDVKILSRSGLDWTWRFPFIAETALKMKQQRFVIDGEICVLDLRGISDFSTRTSTTTKPSSTPSTWLELDGDDLRELPLFDRKAKLGKLLKGRPEGMFIAPFEAGEIGPGLFEAACRMGLEGLVSKHRERRYRPRTCDWVKVKNRQHPAFRRVLDSF